MKKIENKRLEKVLAILVELVEFIIIVCIAIFILKSEIKDVLTILLVFFISRFSIGEAGHYKIVNYFDGGWRRCFFWTMSLILSLSLVTHVGLLVGVLSTIFTSFILSGKANIEDLCLGWKVRNSPSKYADIEEYIKYNSLSTDLIDYEEKLKKQDKINYMIYKYRFKEKMTFAQISERLYLDNPRINEKLEQIAFSFRIYFSI